MKRLAVRTGVIALAVAGLSAAALVDLASADAECLAQGGGLGVKRARIRWVYGGGTAAQCDAPNLPVSPENKNLAAGAWPPAINGPNNLTVLDLGAGPCFGSGFKGSVSYNFTNDVAFTYALPSGNASGGGLQTQALPNQVSACVGLYGPDPSAWPGGDPPPDSMVAIGIARNAANVTLTFLGGGLQTRLQTAGEKSSARLRVIVYPNLAAADADPNRTGAGASSGGIGEVTLHYERLYGNLRDRFVLRDDGGGRRTARLVGAPAPFVVGMADQAAADAAVVVVFGDVISRPAPSPAVPGHSTFGLIILTFVLVASGLWVILARRRAPVA